MPGWFFRGLALASALGLGVWSFAGTQPADPPAPRPAAASLPLHAAVGNAGCSAAACHGRADAASLVGNIGPESWQSSATHWAAADPHRLAFASLEKPLAAAMMAHLRAGDPTFNADAAAETRCLACHSNPALAAAGSRELRAEGVSCEGCHGNAADWRFGHTGWKTPARRDAEYAPSGMNRLFDPATRAAECAGCHVGAPADPARGLPTRDMNHDMIAAGHPRLTFDYRSALARMNPHWREKNPRPAVENWKTGRDAAAAAHAGLHADRKARGAVPELSEFNCAACHHGIRPTDFRGTTPGFYAGRTPGIPVKLAPPPAAAAKSPAELLQSLASAEAGLARIDWDRACDLFYALRAAESDLAAAGKLDVAAFSPDFAEAAAILEDPNAFRPVDAARAFRPVLARLRAAAEAP